MMVLNIKVIIAMVLEVVMVVIGEREWRDFNADFYKDFEPNLKHPHDSRPERNREPEKIGRDCPDCGNDLVI